MDLLLVPQEIKDAICLHQILRKVGIPTDDIFLALPRKQDRKFGVEIKDRGVILLGRTSLSDKELSEGWEKLATAIVNHEIGQEALNKMFRESVVSQQKYLHILAQALVNAGYAPPRNESE